MDSRELHGGSRTSTSSSVTIFFCLSYSGTKSMLYEILFDNLLKVYFTKCY